MTTPTSATPSSLAAADEKNLAEGSAPTAQLEACPELDRLADGMRLASHALQWILREDYQLAVNDPLRLANFESVVRQGEDRWRQAVDAYLRHIAKHGCAPRISNPKRASKA